MADEPATSATRFRDLYDRHVDKVYGYIAFRLAGDLETTGDLCQDVFEAALDDLDMLRDESRFRGWVFEIARHKIADHFRAHAARDGLGPIDATLVRALAETSSPEELDRRERALITAEVMRRIPAHYAELLEDKYIRGMTMKEIGQHRHLTDKAVESALSRAREAFRRDYAALHAKEEAAR